MAKYKILKINDNNVLVIVLSLEMLQEYWETLLMDMRKKNISSSMVYFDLLYRNGKSKRFLQASFDGEKLMSNIVVKAKIPIICEKSADMFLYKNHTLYKGSVLSSAKLLMFLSQIKRKYNL